MTGKDVSVGDEQLWYKDGVIYELHIKAFHDSNDDGIGDFNGLTRKLDYLESLGVTAIWLLPFYPSPLRDDGYDISDYFNINPDYGTLRDFRVFLREAHRRGMRVITELVLNHTSDQHAWFQRARRSRPHSIWRNFYVWSESPEKYQDARIIFKDFEASNWTWDPVVKAHYWHRFYSHQPDLNFENPHVHKALFRIIDFWLQMGVDGLRLDAVPYLYEREGTNCENLPETYEFLRKLRKHVDLRYENRMLLAEANQWPEDASAYFGSGDMCHMAFHFPLMPRMFMSVQMEDRFPIVDILEQTPEIPETCQWAMFLRNHDELTLEMVTDEERDYMYRVYAQDPRAKINLGIRRRLAPLLNNNRRKMELMNILLFTMPGTPVVYYGDEIGMGDNYYLGDRDGVRTPVQWSPDRNAGFSIANPQKLFLPVIIDPEYHYEAINVETQEKNPSSLLWWMKRTIAIRKKFRAFGRGSLLFLFPDNPKVLSFLRTYGDEILLVVVNLSRFSQVAELDLSEYAGCVPEDVFSLNRFPVISDAPYMITLSPHGYLIFQLVKESEELVSPGEREYPVLSVRKRWTGVLEGEHKRKLEKEILPAYIRTCRWFGGKARVLRQVKISEALQISSGAEASFLLFLEASYAEGAGERYVLPLCHASSERIKEFLSQCPQCIIALVRVGDTEGVIFDGIYDEGFRHELFMLIVRRKKLKWKQRELVANQGKIFRALLEDRQVPLVSQVMKAEQSNTSVLYDELFILKLYRRLDEGVNPDVELSRLLTEKVSFPHIAPFAGAIEYLSKGHEPYTIAQLQGFVKNEGDAWTYTINTLGRFFEEIVARKDELRNIMPDGKQQLSTELPERTTEVEYLDDILKEILNTEAGKIPPVFYELLDSFYIELAGLLGQRTGEMHLSLAANHSDPQFSPEPFSLLYQRSVYQSMRSQTRRVFQLLRKVIKQLALEMQEQAAILLHHEQDIIDHFGLLLGRKISAKKIRIHGDYHLGQVLFTGKDFVIIDFEGEPARAVSERKIKRSPFRDVAGMIRSFHYAAHTSFLQHVAMHPSDSSELQPWIEPWFTFVSAAFIGSYMRTVEGAEFIPGDLEHVKLLLEVFLLDKAVYELAYELNNRPEWAIIPMRGLRHILQMIQKPRT